MVNRRHAQPAFRQSAGDDWYFLFETDAIAAGTSEELGHNDRALRALEPIDNTAPDICSRSHADAASLCECRASRQGTPWRDAG